MVCGRPRLKKSLLDLAIRRLICEPMRTILGELLVGYEENLIFLLARERHMRGVYYFWREAHEGSL